MIKEHQILLDKIVGKLTMELNPEKIYLFGSYCWGKPNINSDFDLLIITGESAESNLNLTRKAYRSLRDLAGIIPIDILIRTNNEISQYVNENGSLFNKIINHGNLLYETA